MGHIGTAVGAKDVEITSGPMEASELVEAVRAMCGSDPGFTIYNTLVLVGESEAFVPASGGRLIGNEEEVVLIPFSHGG